jgi:hypothetical protein
MADRRWPIVDYNAIQPARMAAADATATISHNKTP